MKGPSPFPSVADIDRVMNVAPLGTINGETSDERRLREEEAREAVVAVLRRLRDLHLRPALTPT